MSIDDPRDQQLAIFEAAPMVQRSHACFVVVNLRDSTFEAHRDEPPLDAFANAINFYIKAPRFAQVIRNDWSWFWRYCLVK